MRHIQIIAEGPEEDVSTHQLAIQMRSGVIRHFMNTQWKSDHWGGSGQIMGDGRHFFRFPPGIFGWPAPFDTAVFAFGPTNGYFPSGFYTRTTKGVPFVSINMVEDPIKSSDFDDAVKQIIHNQRAHEVLLHELIHMIDDFRDRDVLGKKSDPDGTRRAEKTPSQTDGPDYYNSPVEFNAYFTNIADRLMGFISRNRDHADAQRTLSDAQRNGFSTDFAKTVANLMKEKEHAGALKTFITLLRKRNHRRLLSRLYKIHQEAAQIIQWAEAAS